MNMKKTSILFSLAVLSVLFAMPARASEVPPGLEPATVVSQPDTRTLEHVGLAPDEAQAMDRVELAQAGKADPDQKGGDAIVTVAVIAAIVILVYIAVQHMDHA